MQVKSDELAVDLLKTDLGLYRSLETWGSSLFLAAIALLGKQLLEWSAADPSPLSVANPAVAYAPAAIGIVAFVFLRVVNFRAYECRYQLGILADQPDKSLGVLGVVISLMPLMAGTFVTQLIAEPLPNGVVVQSTATTAAAASFLTGMIASGVQLFVRRRQALSRAIAWFKAIPRAIVRRLEGPDEQLTAGDAA